MAIFCLDLDGVLCETIRGNYEQSTPIKERIDIVNKLYDNGDYIIIDTARGSLTRLEWLGLTKQQLKDWGLKYHELRVGGKPFANFYIDDHAINSKDFFGV